MLFGLCFICLSVLPLLGKSSSSSTDFAFPQDCGLRKIRNSRVGRVKRIVGGSQSFQGKWPWQAALFFHGSHYCGGAIISDTWIVTAAHCFNPRTSKNPADWTVVLGDHHHVKRDDRFEQRRNVVSIIVHENYESMYFEGIEDIPPVNDITIMKLNRPVTFNRYVQPVCLPRPSDVFAPNEECYVAGWGHTEWNGAQPDILREAKVRIISREVCNQEKSYDGKIHGIAMCAGYPEGGRDACEYDSGGPLVCVKCGRHYVAGLVSWGYQCALPNKYGVYANMTVLTPWVKDKISRFERDSASKTPKKM